MENYDVIIVGAGISGLSFAHFCGRDGKKTLVIEKGSQAGGAFCSLRTGNFWLELGAHTCYNTYTSLIRVIEEAGLRSRMIGREKVSFKMLVDNKVKSIPSQLSFHELLSSAFSIFTLKKQGRSMHSYYGRIVGMRNFEQVFAPAFNAVISQDARDFPAEMLFKKRPRRKDILRKYTFEGGLQTVTDALSSEQNVTLLTGVDTSSVAYDGSAFSVSTADGRSFTSPVLGLAVPVSGAAQFLSQSFPAVAESLREVRTAPVESMGVVIRKNETDLPLFAGLIPVSDSFFSIVSRDTVSHPDYRGFTFHFRPAVMDRDAKIRRICDVLGTPAAKIETVAEKTNIIPSPRVGHDRIVAEVDRLISGRPLLLCGNYFNGVAIEDCVQRSIAEFERLKKG